jgi:DNA-binding transcriptional MocR family regulator
LDAKFRTLGWSGARLIRHTPIFSDTEDVPKTPGRYFYFLGFTVSLGERFPRHVEFPAESPIREELVFAPGASPVHDFVMKAIRLPEALGAWSTRAGPLHLRLSEALEDAISRGILLPGARLPAERAAAKALSLSRTTIVSAYGNLRDRGWLESKTGSGTWVSRGHASGARSHAHSNVVTRGSLLNLLQVNDPTLIDLAMATPEPLGDLVECAIARAQEDIRNLIRQRNYMPFGLPSLRNAVASSFAKAGTPTTPEQILITTGAQQAISIITSLFVHRGDSVLVEDPTYFGALEVFRFVGARMTPVPVLKEHVLPEVLAQRISAARPRLIYISPTCHNPTGAVMPTFARRQIAHDAEQHQIPIIEDETLAEMTYRGNRPPAIAAYSNTAPILTVGSLSKLFCPGLRIGWIRGPVALLTRLAKLKTAADLGSSLLPQAVAAELFSYMDDARKLRSSELRSKKAAVIRILRSQTPDWVFDEPRGGLSLWVKIPNTDAMLLAQVALRSGVTIAPGNLFSVDESYPEFVRLPFLLQADSLMEGVNRLLAAWQEMSGDAGSGSSLAVLSGNNLLKHVSKSLS